MIAMGIEQAAINMATALVCGAVIGSERQVRQRMAGLRTNALVALGAAAFVIFAAQFPDEVSPTRMAAQVVSGIGFLGAGIIFRDGFNVHGLNTAATLWCSAAVGLMAGAGALPLAALLTGLVVFVNLGLRPLVRWLKRHTSAGEPHLRQFRVTATCSPVQEAAIRALLLRQLPLSGLHLSEISVAAAAEGSMVEVSVLAGAESMPDSAIELAIARLGTETGVARLQWAAVDEG